MSYVTYLYQEPIGGMEHFIGKYAVLLPYMEGVWNNTLIKVAMNSIIILL